MSKYIYVKMLKEWGGYAVGDIVRFGENKGRGRIEKGEGVEVKKQKSVNDIIETASLNPNIAPDAKAKVKAKAKAKAKANKKDGRKTK